MTRKDYPPGEGPARGIVYAVLLGAPIVATVVTVIMIVGGGS